MPVRYKSILRMCCLLAALTLNALLLAPNPQSRQCCQKAARSCSAAEASAVAPAEQLAQAAVHEPDRDSAGRGARIAATASSDINGLSAACNRHLSATRPASEDVLGRLHIDRVGS